MSISDVIKTRNAINKMIAMTDIAERENAAEMLLEAKGFNRCGGKYHRGQL